MITLKNIRESVQLRQKSRIPTDGWAEPLIKLDEVLSEPFPTDTIKLKLILEIGRVIVCNENLTVPAVKNGCEAIYYELYGDIINDLHKLKHLIYWSEKEEVEGVLNNLISKLSVK